MTTLRSGVGCAWSTAIARIDRALFEKYRRRFHPYGSVASLYLWAVSGGAIPELTDPAPKSANGGK